MKMFKNYHNNANQGSPQWFKNNPEGETTIIFMLSMESTRKQRLSNLWETHKEGRVETQLQYTTVLCCF